MGVDDDIIDASLKLLSQESFAGKVTIFDSMIELGRSREGDLKNPINYEAAKAAQ